MRPRVAADDAAIATVNDNAFGSAAESSPVQALREAGLAAKTMW